MSKFPAFLVVLTSGLATIVVAGCATNNFNYTYEAPVIFKRVPSEDVHISEALAYEDGDELVIYGKVKRGPDNCCDAVRGHVDIVVIGPEGYLLDMASTMYRPRNIPKVRSRSSRFRVRLPYTLPDGVTIRIAYHSRLGAADSVAYAGSMFRCEQNMAIPGGKG